MRAIRIKHTVWAVSALFAVLHASAALGQFSSSGSRGGSSSSGGSSSGGSSSSSPNFGSSGFGNMSFGSMGFGSTGTGSSGFGSSGLGTSGMTGLGGYGSSSLRGGSGVGSTFTVSPTNPLASYYSNPLAQGMMNSTGTGTGSSGRTGTSGTTTASFGAPLYNANTLLPGGTTTTGRGLTGSRSLGGLSSGLRSGTMSRGMSGLGGYSSGSPFFATNAGTNRDSTFAMGLPGLFPPVPPPPDGGPGPGMAIGPPSVPPTKLMPRPDLQQVIQRSTRLPSAGNIQILTDGQAIILRGQVGSDHERRLAENMLRLSPGVREIRNELDLVEQAPMPRPGP